MPGTYWNTRDGTVATWNDISSGLTQNSPLRLTYATQQDICSLLQDNALGLVENMNVTIKVECFYPLYSPGMCAQTRPCRSTFHENNRLPCPVFRGILNDTQNRRTRLDKDAQ